jgi:hypothetical protein
MRTAFSIVMAAVLLSSCGSGSDGSSSDGSSRPSPTNDPATVEGACRIMLDGPDDLLQQTLTFPRPKSASAADRSAAIQEQLFEIVAAEQETLADPVGVLVDFLDDPRAYTKDGKLDDSITQAVATIRTTCADQ